MKKPALRFFLVSGVGLSLIGSMCEAATGTTAQGAMAAPGSGDAAKIFNVINYGAQNDGQSDAQIAVAKAISAAKEWTEAAPTNKATVYFPAGTYSFTRILDRFAVNLNGLKNITIEGERCSDNTAANYCVKLVGASASLNARVQLANYNSFFLVSNSHNIVIENFYLDKEHPYFTQGTVVSINATDKSMDLRMDRGYSDFNDPLVSALLKSIVVFTDPQLRTWDHSDAACSDNAHFSPGDSSCHNIHILFHQQIGSDIWRISVDQTPAAEFSGRPFLMWRNLGWQSGFMVDRSSDVTISNIFYTGGGGPGVHIQGSDGVNSIRNFVVDIPARSGRLFSATSGFNGSRNRGEVLIDSVSIAHSDDDAFHFAAGNYYPVLDQANTKIRVELCYDGDFRPGDQVAAWNWTSKSPRSTAAVVSSQTVQDTEPQKYHHACDITLDRPLPVLANLRTYDDAQVGRAKDYNDRVVNLSMKAHLTVRNSHLSSMRARCGIIQVPAEFTNNICQNVVLNGLIIGPEFVWGEGYAVDGVKVVNNHFDNISGTAIYVADILDSNKPPSYSQLMSSGTPDIDSQKDNHNIVIEGNTFSNLGTFGHGIMGIRGVAITIENADGVQVTGNQITHAPSFHRDSPTDIVVSPATTNNVIVR